MPAGTVFPVPKVRECALDRGALQKQAASIWEPESVSAPPLPPVAFLMQSWPLQGLPACLGRIGPTNRTDYASWSLALRSRSWGTVCGPQEPTGSFWSIMPSSPRLICSSSTPLLCVISSTKACLHALTPFIPSASCITQAGMEIAYLPSSPLAENPWRELVLLTEVFPGNSPGWGIG